MPLQSPTESEYAEKVVIALHNFIALLVSANGIIYIGKSLKPHL